MRRISILLVGLAAILACVWTAGCKKPETPSAPATAKLERPRVLAPQVKPLPPSGKKIEGPVAAATATTTEGTPTGTAAATPTDTTAAAATPTDTTATGTAATTPTGTSATGTAAATPTGTSATGTAAATPTDTAAEAPPPPEVPALTP